MFPLSSGRLLQHVKTCYYFFLNRDFLERKPYTKKIAGDLDRVAQGKCPAAENLGELWKLRASASDSLCVGMLDSASDYIQD